MLRDALPQISQDAPTYPAHRPVQAVAALQGYFEQLLASLSSGEPLLLIGSSMGGFYGRYLAQQLPFDHLLMINPALQPWDLLPEHEGWQETALGEHYYLSAQTFAETRDYAVEAGDGPVPVTLLLDEADEVIDYRIAARIFRGSADLHIYPGGDHAFQHMDEAVAIIARLHAGIAERKRVPG
ncbi:protein of unknown function UPF0227 [endosymbiont of Tevnia jerichonana (vent Tica)]|uniref:Esterase n=1 Tax=endosymbiont of Tevnia jerichonana (vent Tica) TaxID=1049564 RepID=G2FF09_9GAMM|nr:protein of unknown function UPF0227 [endosymbiont of Tevnia jerichonana (vent Tica)]